MITSLYYISGLIMCVWYVAGYRWTMQGNELGRWIVKASDSGKIIGNGFMLNWWFAPINMITAFLSAYFVVRAFFFVGQSFTQNMAYIASFLLIRNSYYAIEDIIDYLHYPSRKQLVFVAVDLIMAAFLVLWILKLKGS